MEWTRGLTYKKAATEMQSLIRNDLNQEDEQLGWWSRRSMELGYEHNSTGDSFELRERLFAGVTIASCVFSFVACFSLTVAVPMIAQSSLTIAESAYHGVKHCNVS